MTSIVKVLKRKDGSSLIVGIIVAMVLIQAIPTLTFRLANWISGVSNAQFNAGGWKSDYLNPVVWAVLQLIVLEVIVYVYCYVHGMITKNKK